MVAQSKVTSVWTSLPFLLLMALICVSCQGQTHKNKEGEKAPEISMPFNTGLGDTVADLGKNIDCIFQDSKGNYWFASNGEGVYRYDGNTMLHITQKNGLLCDFVWTIHEDPNGKLWFSTRDGFCCLDGHSFSNYTDIIQQAAYGTLAYSPGALFFSHLDGVCYYDGKVFTNFIIHPPVYIPDKSSMYRPYGVYCTLADRDGQLWFGTQEKGVCVYNGKSFSYLDAKDLGGPAVRSILQDTKGRLWFGNNGAGLYLYEAGKLRNITEEKKLGNPEFLKEKKPVDKAGSMARVFAINEDPEGNIWIGTVDAGVWKYDGSTLKNYTSRDGLSGNSVAVIYKDKSGELWFVSNGEAIYRFNGQRFLKINFNSNHERRN